MLLTVDIGNTHIIIGGFQIKDKSVAQTPSFIARFLTEHRKTDDQYAMAISQLLSLYHIDDALLLQVGVEAHALALVVAPTIWKIIRTVPFSLS